MLSQQWICQDVASLFLVINTLILEFHYKFPDIGCCQIDALDEDNIPHLPLRGRQRIDSHCLVEYQPSEECDCASELIGELEVEIIRYLKREPE